MAKEIILDTTGTTDETCEVLELEREEVLHALSNNTENTLSNRFVALQQRDDDDLDEDDEDLEDDEIDLDEEIVVDEEIDVDEAEITDEDLDDDLALDDEDDDDEDDL